MADDEAEHHGVLRERVRLAVLPNGSRGWVPRSSLGGWSFVDTRLVIDRAGLTAELLQAGRVIFRARVAVGAPRTPTPAGQFYVLDRLSSFSGTSYGPLAFGTNARSPTLTDWPHGGVIGIHGTNRPDVIPGRMSHGCVQPPATDRIERVKALQSQLSWLGFEPGQVDRRYGPLTTGAVRRFQEARDLPVDGVVDPLTQRALEHHALQQPQN
ncbi:MAG: L,D-transpeptidase family protein [Solirubrobacteraceae bacterium]